MRIAFWKMHGAGNDFILVDDRSETFPASDSGWIARIAQRRTGVGCEGVLLIQKSAQADFRMRFFNPDGREAEMCGNGARCVARLAHEIGAAPRAMSIETAAGILRAEAMEDRVRLTMTDPRDWRLGRRLVAGGVGVDYGFVNTGVPHAVVFRDDLDACDVAGLGAAIRYHPDFAPAGTNANFVKKTGPRSIRVRTYERGVEAETLACGTGIVASALVAARAAGVQPPVDVTARGGDVLSVDFRLTADGAERVTLLGPAVHVFRGTLDR
jgi:diaminopimelate epimerase